MLLMSFVMALALACCSLPLGGASTFPSGMIVTDTVCLRNLILCVESTEENVQCKAIPVYRKQGR